MEEQLLKPHHQTILDLGDGNAESLQSVIANLYAVSSKDGFDIEKLYTKAVESGDVSAYCTGYNANSLLIIVWGSAATFFYLATQKHWYNWLVFTSGSRKHFINSQKITLNYRRSPKGRFGYSMFTSCSLKKEKAPTKTL